MPLLDWDKSFELGIKEFDDHHQQLVRLLNETYDNFITGATHTTMEGILDQLVDYATYHFAAEERWMGLNGYTELQKHREEHTKFSRRIVEVQIDFRVGKSRISLELLTLLKDWLTDHILGSDAEYGSFASQRKLIPAPA